MKSLFWAVHSSPTSFHHNRKWSALVSTTSEDWFVEQHSQPHNADLKWLNTQVKSIVEFEPHPKTIILTHHSPTVSTRAASPTNESAFLRVLF